MSEKKKRRHLNLSDLVHPRAELMPPRGQANLSAFTEETQRIDNWRVQDFAKLLFWLNDFPVQAEAEHYILYRPY
jgi:hypothetical protein